MTPGKPRTFTRRTDPDPFDGRTGYTLEVSIGYEGKLSFTIDNRVAILSPQNAGELRQKLTQWAKETDTRDRD